MDAQSLILQAFWAFLGLVIGSFCNVVILRLPKMMLAAIEDEVQASHTPEGLSQMGIENESVSLSHPGSHCPHCGTPLKARELIPLLSFILQGGKCLHCKASIAWQYPIVEILSALWWGFCAHQFLAHPISNEPLILGLPALYLSALLWSLLGSALLCLSFIDLAHHLLPDAITQPLLWTGLIAAHLGLLGIDLDHALVGAVMGYASLSTIALGYKLFTGLEGMGQGDMKLLAVFGAWIGAWSLITLVFLASGLGLVFGVAQLLLKKDMNLKSEIAFGPFLITSFLVLLLIGPSHALELMGLSSVATQFPIFAL
jgi:leader peptidase (prepilin peptidase)/N-methyltransferase